MHDNRILVYADAFSVITDRCIKYGNRALVNIEARENLTDTNVIIAD